MACQDFWAWVPARLNNGCGGSPPLFTSLQVVGHVNGPVSPDPVVKANWMIALPWTTSQQRNLDGCMIYAPARPGGHVIVHVRAALYRSRSERCGYPGALFADLGIASVSDVGTWAFEDGYTGPLPKCELCWFVTWYEFALQVNGLSDYSGDICRAWPVLQFREPADFVPYCGWAAGHVWAPPEDEAWPDPFEDEAFPLDFKGRQPGNPDPIHLPALYLLES